MKNLLFSFFALTIATSSCRKIIDIELEEGDKKTVIEASLYQGPNDFIVKVTQTGNFFGNRSPIFINNAVINLSDGISTFPLTFTGNGNYNLLGFNAVSGTEYTLTVDENGNNFEAKTTMPSRVDIDTIRYSFIPGSDVNDDGYVTQLEFIDPAFEDNFYRIKGNISDQNIGGIRDLILRDDSFEDGNRIEVGFFGIYIAKLGDTVTMNLLTTNKSTFDYLEGILVVSGGGDGAPPANPKSNFNNNALGNFSAFATDTMTIVVQ